MMYDVHEDGARAVCGSDIGSGGPMVRVYIGEAGASFIDDTVGTGNITPCCRFEVRGDGRLTP
jgi:hypothetical protein